MSIVGEARDFLQESGAGPGMHIQVERILDIDARFGEQIGIDALRPEAKILFTLKARGSLSVKEAMALSGLSYRGFYIVLARLTANGWIVMEGDAVDKRVKRIMLSGRDFAEYPAHVHRPVPYPAS